MSGQAVGITRIMSPPLEPTYFAYNTCKGMADYTGNTTYTHNQGGEKKGVPQNRLAEKGPSGSCSIMRVIH